MAVRSVAAKATAADCPGPHHVLESPRALFPHKPASRFEAVAKEVEPLVRMGAIADARHSRNWAGCRGSDSPPVRSACTGNRRSTRPSGCARRARRTRQHTEQSRYDNGPDIKFHHLIQRPEPNDTDRYPQPGWHRGGESRPLAPRRSAIAAARQASGIFTARNISSTRSTIRY